MNEDMKKSDNPDDVIYIIGGSGNIENTLEDKKGKAGAGKWKTVSAVLAAVMLAGIAAFAGKRLYSRFEYPRSRADSEIVSMLHERMQGQPGIGYSEKEVLGVSMKIYAIRGLKAYFADSIPPYIGEDIFLMTRNSDYRIKNGYSQIIGDYAVDGELMAKSTWRAGFMAVVDGNAQIGISRGGKVLRYVLGHDGSFFRQLAIVSAGVRCPSQYILKGKVSRCAYARDIDNNLYYVETVYPETLFGFADALIETGFVDAVYVTGGAQQSLFYRDSTGVAHGSYSDDKPHTMVIWRRD